MLAGKHALIAFICIAAGHCYSQVASSEVTLGCLNLGRIPGDLVIERKTEYEKIFESYTSPHPDCYNYKGPAIDFDNEILIGLKADTGGCSEPDRVLNITSINKVCYVDLVITQKGICRALFQKQMWILVKKSDCSKVIIQKKTQEK